MNNNNHVKILLANLFLFGKSKKSQFDDLTEQEQRKFLESLSKLKLTLIHNEKEVTLAAENSLYEFIENKIDNTPLTESASEILTLILYCGPISKSDIDYIRGVNSGNSLRRLLMRNLIEKQSSGSSVRYIPSSLILGNLGIRKVDELPNYNNFCKKIEEVLGLKVKMEK